jgi:hypothetical protein
LPVKLTQDNKNAQVYWFIRIITVNVNCFASLNSVSPTNTYQILHNRIVLLVDGQPQSSFTKAAPPGKNVRGVRSVVVAGAVN